MYSYSDFTSSFCTKQQFYSQFITEQMLTLVEITIGQRFILKIGKEEDISEAIPEHKWMLLQPKISGLVNVSMLKQTEYPKELGLKALAFNVLETIIENIRKDA